MVTQASVLWMLEDYVTIDIERSVLEIIEISAVRVRKNTIVESFTSLVKPKHKIDKHTYKIHAITDQMTRHAPSYAQVYLQFLEFIQDDVLVGHGIHGDLFSLNKQADRENLPKITNYYLDTLRLLSHIPFTLENKKLTTLAEYFNAPPVKHRALADAMASHYVYQGLKSSLTESQRCFFNAFPPLYPRDYYPERLEDCQVKATKEGFFTDTVVCIMGSTKLYSTIEMILLLKSQKAQVRTSLTRAADYVIMDPNNEEIMSQIVHFNQKGARIHPLTESEFCELIKR